MRLILVSLSVLVFMTLAVPSVAGPRLGPDRIFDSGDVLRQASAETGVNLDRGGDEKTTKKAMLYSMLLPGLGEHYLGHTTRAKAFFVAEGAIWSAFAVFKVQGSHRKDLYREFAELKAGVPERDDDEYYRVIGNFDSADGPGSANEQVRREARAIFPNQPAQQQQYFDENAYLGDDAWAWESTELRARFKDMRSSSLDAYHRADLSLGLLVANRVLSVLDAGLLAARHRQDGDTAGHFSWEIETGREGPGARITLARTF